MLGDYSRWQTRGVFFWLLSLLCLAAHAHPDDARWDDRFALPGADLNHGSAKAIAVLNGEVYASTMMNMLGGRTINGLARWAESGWRSVNGGVTGIRLGDGNEPTQASAPGYINVILEHKGRLFVAGHFLQAGGIGAKNVAVWDGGKWSSLGYTPVNGDREWLHAMAILDDGTLYVGGGDHPNGSPESRISRWDGKQWTVLPKGISVEGAACSVEELTANQGGEIYAVANIYYTDRKRMWEAGLFRWNGANWSRMPEVPLHGVQALALTESGDLYAGGEFRKIGDQELSGIARWDGRRWWALGTGLRGYATQIALRGNDVYVSGRFSGAGEVECGGLAKWDGYRWHGFGKGVAGGGSMYLTSATNCVLIDLTSVSHFVFSGNDIYVVGSFYRAGDVGANGFARWDGRQWAGLASRGGTFGINGPVNTFLVVGTNLCAGGRFTTAGGVAVASMARWNGHQWASFGAPGFVEVNAFASTGTDFFVAGRHAEPGSSVAKWDGLGWAKSESSRFDWYNVMVAHGQDLYLGSQTIRKWNGLAWDALGTGRELNSSTYVRALAVSEQGDVYIGGTFRTVGGINAHNIAKWDGQRWSALDGGIYGTVFAMAFHGGDLYVVGQFQGAGKPVRGRYDGETKVNGVARWDGQRWHPLGNGLGGGQLIRVISALAFHGDDLYVGGGFEMIGGVKANSIAKWDGKEWSALGSGLGAATDNPNDMAHVTALAVQGNSLYVGGRFGSAGDKPSVNFARWELSARP